MKKLLIVLFILMAVAIPPQGALNKIQRLNDDIRNYTHDIDKLVELYQGGYYETITLHDGATFTSPDPPVIPTPAQRAGYKAKALEICDTIKAKTDELIAEIL